MILFYFVFVCVCVRVCAGTSPAHSTSPVADGLGAEHSWCHYAQQVRGERNGESWGCGGFPVACNVSKKKKKSI